MKKICDGLGINNVCLWVSGLVLFVLVVIEWFVKIGIYIFEGWGMIENSVYGIGSVFFCYDKIGCIGKLYDGVDICMLEEGEI